MLSLGFNYILTATLWGTLTGLFIWGIRCLFSQKISANAMFLMWSIFLLKLTIPFGPQSAFSLFNLFYPIYSVQSSINVRLEQIAPAASSAVSQAAALPDIKMTASIIWLTITASFGLWFFISDLILKYRLSRLTPCRDERMTRLLKDAQLKTGTTVKVQLLIQPFISTPSLYGILNPKILLPPNMNEFSDDELSYVFLHELSHYRRCDMITNYLLIILQILHWFNPFIWFFLRKVREDMELATDEAAMKKMKETDYLSYGRTLLMAVERFSIYKIRGSMMSMAHTKSNLKRRLKRIYRFKKPPISWSLFTIALTLVLSLTCLTDAKQFPLLSIPQVCTSSSSAELSDFLNQHSKQENNEKLTPSPIPTAGIPDYTSNYQAPTNKYIPNNDEIQSQEPYLPETHKIPATTAEPASTHKPVKTSSPLPEENLPDENIVSPSATRSLLTPGTNYNDMLHMAEENGTFYQNYLFEEGETRLYTQTDSNGYLRFYLNTDSVSSIEIEILDPNSETVIAKLDIVPRTYFIYVISGLKFKTEYLLNLFSESDGQLLIY